MFWIESTNPGLDTSLSCTQATIGRLAPRWGYTIIDMGEGQCPSEFKDTFMSIGKSNKLRIPFVQGKFNMGGTARPPKLTKLIINTIVPNAIVRKNLNDQIII